MTATVSRLFPLDTLSFFKSFFVTPAPSHMPDVVQSAARDSPPLLAERPSIDLALHEHTGVQLRDLLERAQESDALLLELIRLSDELKGSLHAMASKNEVLETKHEALKVECELRKKEHQTLQPKYDLPAAPLQSPPMTPPLEAQQAEHEPQTPPEVSIDDATSGDGVNEMLKEAVESVRRALDEQTVKEEELLDFQQDLKASEKSKGISRQSRFLEEQVKNFASMLKKHRGVLEASLTVATPPRSQKRLKQALPRTPPPKLIVCDDTPRSVDSALSMGSLNDTLPAVDGPTPHRQKLSTTPLVKHTAIRKDPWVIEFNHVVQVPRSVRKPDPKVGGCLFAGYDLLSKAASGWTGGNPPMPDVIDLAFEVASRCGHRFVASGCNDHGRKGQYFASHAEAQLLTFLVTHMYPEEFEKHRCTRDNYFCRSRRHPPRKDRITIWASKTPCNQCKTFCRKINDKFGLEVVLRETGEDESDVFGAPPTPERTPSPRIRSKNRRN